MASRASVPLSVVVAGLGVYGLSMAVPWIFETEAAFFGAMPGAILPLAWMVGFGLVFAASTIGRSNLVWGRLMAWACTTCLVAFALFPLAINGDGVDVERRFGLFVALLGSGLVAVGASLPEAAAQAGGQPADT